MKIISPFFPLVLAFVAVVGFSSCVEDCYECTGNGTDSVEYCEANLGSSGTDLAVASYEALGGTCAKK